MTKIIKSKYKISRRLGTSLWGDSKDAYNKKNYRPGQHGQNTMNKISDYGLHLKAKQRLKYHYGRIGEKQFKNTFTLALKTKGNTGENFISLLERRLDIVVYRLKIAPTIFAARQLINHNHIILNGNKVNIPSIKLYENDIIEISKSASTISLIVESINRKDYNIPSYLTFDVSTFKGKFIRIPSISDIQYPFQPEVQLVIELYSR